MLAFAIPVMMRYEFTVLVYQPVLAIPGSVTSHIEQKQAIKQVFDVLIDHKKYQEWNTFTDYIKVIETSSGDSPSGNHRLTEGDKVIMHNNLSLPFGLGNLNTWMNKTSIFLKEVEQDKRICWSYQLTSVLGLQKTRRCIEVTLNPSGDTVLIRHFVNIHGMIGPFVRLLFANCIEGSLSRFNRDLQAHIKHLKNDVHVSPSNISLEDL